MDFGTVELLLMDLDGTLANTLPVLYSVYQTLLRRYGIEGSREEFQQLNGPSLDEIVTSLKEKHQISADSIEFLDIYQTLLKSQYLTKAQPFPGATEFLAKAQQVGYQMALVTSAPAQLATAFLDIHHLRSFFSHIVTPDSGLRSKPHPDLFLHALAELDQPAETALVFEDSPNGLAAAHSARLRSVWMHQQPETLPEGVCAAFSNWEEAASSLFSPVKHD